MSPEQIQAAIEGILAVQRGLQASQLEFHQIIAEQREEFRELIAEQREEFRTENALFREEVRAENAATREAINELRIEISDLKESTRWLNEVSKRHERRLEQLIGYSITAESDRLTLEERVLNLERRFDSLKD